MFLTFLLLAIVFNYDLLLGPYSLVRHHDAFDTEYINLAARGKLFLENGFFGWYPNFAGGMPSFAERIPPYYLPSVISSIIPIWLIYIIWRVGLMALAGYGMYRMLMDYFRVSQEVAIFGGIFFALYRGSYVHLVFDYVFPIFFIWSMELCKPGLDFDGKVKRILGLIGILLITYPVITLQSYPLYHFAIVVMFGWKSENFKRHVLGTLLIWTGFVLFFSPHIYRLFEYVPFAHRDFITPFASTGSIPFTYDGIVGLFGDFLGKFIKSAFITNPTLLFFLFGLPLLRSSRRVLLVSALFIVPSLVHAMFASQFIVLLSGTFLVKMDLVHFHMVNIVSNTLVAAIVLQEMRLLPLSRLARYAAVAIGLFVAMRIMIGPVNPGGHLVNISTVQVLSFALGLSVVGIMRREELSKTFGIHFPLLSKVLLAFFVASLAGVGMIAKHPENLVQPYRRMYENHQELYEIAEEQGSDVFRVACAGVHPAVPLSYGLETAGQRGALFNKYYKQFIKTVITPQLASPEAEKSFDTYWYEVFLTPFPKKTCASPANWWNMPLLHMLNVKYLISDKPIEGIEEFADLYAETKGTGLPFEFLRRSRFNRFFTMPLWIYRLREAFPRGYLAGIPVVLEKREEVLQQLAEQTLTDLHNKVFLYAEDVDSLNRQKVSAKASDRFTNGSVQIAEYGSDRIIFIGVAGSPCFLVITNNYDPKWSAYVNGKKAPVYRANHAFQTVYIDEAGPFQVVMEYKESTVWWLHVAIFAGLALFVVCGFLGWGKTPEAGSPGIGDGYMQDRCISQVKSLEETFQKKKAPCWLMGLTGLVMAAVHVVWAVYLFVPNPGWSSQTIKGVMLYNALIVPVVGILLSFWAILIVREL